jgi:transposase InsO family protein
MGHRQIDELMGPAQWSYFCLYVIIDIFSRRVVGWHVADASVAGTGSKKPAARATASQGRFRSPRGEGGGFGSPRFFDRCSRGMM